MGSVLVPRHPLTPCHLEEQGGKRDQVLPSHPTPTPSLSESCLIGATGHSSVLPLVFPESHTKDSRRLFLQEPASWSRPPRRQLTPESQRLWPLCLCLCGHEATQPSPALGTKDASEQKGFSSSPSNEDFFSLQTAVAAREGEGGCNYSCSVDWVFWTCHRPPEWSSGAGCTLRRACHLPKPYSPTGQRGGLPPPGVPLALFLKPPPDRVPSGKGRW